jgi:xanthine dehydrogenase YagS FAD-binding subunit
MKNFEYAQPRTEAEVLEVLASAKGSTELLAGGTDLVGLMTQMIVTPDRVVDLGQVASLQTIHHDPLGQLWVGAGVHLDDFLSSRMTDPYPAVKQAIQGIASVQLQAQGTLGGELLRRPRCWYFRNGAGLLAEQGRRVVQGDNRYHAILGNRGPAKFVSASRLAPALISLRAHARVIGPNPEDEQLMPLERLFQAPNREDERENSLGPRQVLTHVILPPDAGFLSAAYEVRHGEGPDAPLAAAAATMEVASGIVRQARVVLGQVAPIPWISAEAERVLIGRPLSEAVAQQAGQAAVADASPLSNNEYKVQLAQVAVKRAILRAAGTEMGGF